jgi:hypothetical protein
MMQFSLQNIYYTLCKEGEGDIFATAKAFKIKIATFESCELRISFELSKVEICTSMAR